MTTSVKHETSVQIVDISGDLRWQLGASRDKVVFGIAPMLFAGIAAKSVQQAYHGPVSIILFYRRHVGQMKALLDNTLAIQPQPGPKHDILVFTPEAATGTTVDHAHFFAVHEREEGEHPGGHVIDPARRWIACTRAKLSLTVYVQKMAKAPETETGRLQRLAEHEGLHIKLNSRMKSLEAFTSLHGSTEDLH